jgi:hypothetical protein
MEKDELTTLLDLSLVSHIKRYLGSCVPKHKIKSNILINILVILGISHHFGIIIGKIIARHWCVPVTFGILAFSKLNY